MCEDESIGPALFEDESTEKLFLCDHHFNLLRVYQRPIPFSLFSCAAEEPFKTLKSSLTSWDTLYCSAGGRQACLGRPPGPLPFGDTICRRWWGMAMMASCSLHTTTTSSNSLELVRLEFLSFFFKKNKWLLIALWQIILRVTAKWFCQSGKRVFNGHSY